MKDPTNPGAIVGRNEAAEICKVSRQRLGVLADGAPATATRKAVDPDPDFPAPICFIDDGRSFWWCRAIEDYQRNRAAKRAAKHPIAA